MDNIAAEILVDVLLRLYLLRCLELHVGYDAMRLKRDSSLSPVLFGRGDDSLLTEVFQQAKTEKRPSTSHEAHVYRSPHPVCRRHEEAGEPGQWHDEPLFSRKRWT
jgi:hypothetical protein